jgi:hypothetical protein
MRFSKSTPPISWCPQKLTSGLPIEWPTENGPNREIRASQDSNDATEEAMGHG